jgi:hypothetical protein
MSETTIFIIGMIVFAITVYGTVMAGGTALTRVEIEQNPEREDGFDDEDLDKPFAFRGKY